MILVTFNKPEFEYDVHSLIKAFYPKEEIQMYYSCPVEEVEGQNLACTHHEIGSDEELLKQAEHIFYIDYGTQDISIRWEEKVIFSEKESSAEELDAAENVISCHSRLVTPASNARIDAKNALKQTLYALLEEVTGQKLPWGTLTGIRPTKIPMKMLEEGVPEEEIFRDMKETYLASDEKVNLAIEIAKREKELLDQLDYEKGWSLYIGIPFCPTTCAYCSFTSFPLKVWKKRVDEYLDAVFKEIDFTAEAFRDRVLNSVYIGGGTPSTLEPYQMDRLIKKIKASFDLTHCVEFTVEAGRPDSTTRELLQCLKDNEITRISINPQTMKQKTLDIIGRHHTVEQTLECYRTAREVGMDNINMDLIIGLPEEDLEDVRNTMEILKELNPENITVHSLAIKRAARMTIYKDRFEDMKMVNTQEHMDLCEQYCRAIGLEPYYMYRQKGMAGNMENVGYAKPGKAGVYNILIMEEKQTIMALGAGATTKVVFTDQLNENGTPHIERAENVKSVEQYIDRIDEMIDRKRKLLGMSK